MKSRTLLAYAAVCAIALSHLNHPLNAAVESDIVGYTTISIPADFKMVSIPFESLDNADGISVQDIQIEGVSVGDEIQYWDGIKLVILTYRTVGSTGWQVGFRVLSDKVFKPGEAFWIKTKSKANLLVSGKVLPVGEAFLTNEAREVALVSSPLPVAYSVQDLQIEGLSVGDEIQYWDGIKLIILTYRTVGSTGWQAGFKVLSDKVFEPGEGFYLITKQKVTVSFPDVRIN